MNSVLTVSDYSFKWVLRINFRRMHSDMPYISMLCCSVSSWS
jgi:hypothetical protein